MNTQRNFCLRRGASPGKGFALPLAIGVGLVMLLASTIMIFRSQRDSVTASNQKQTNQSLGVAEAGIARVLNILPQYPTLATYNFADWKNANATTPAVPGLVSCDNANGGSTVDNFADTAANWTNLDPNDISKGQYKVIDYQYSDPTNHLTPGTGTLTVAGRLRSGTLSLAGTYLSVQIPVANGGVRGIPFPGIWLTDGGTGNNTLQANVFLNDCSPSANSVVIGTDPTTGDAHQVLHTNLSFPALPAKPLVDINLPLGSLSLNGGRTTISLNSNLTLPRGTDIPVTKVVDGQSIQVYEYHIAGDFDIAGSARLTVTPGAKVYFYLDGDIPSPSGDIMHDCGSNTSCKPTDFHIYGYGPSGSEICTNGVGYIEAFILAPNYSVGVAGSGGGQGGIEGALWANSWSNNGGCGSNTSNIVATQAANWNQLAAFPPQQLPPRVAPLQSWQRQEQAGGL
ncbi:MAG: hypothetical protein H7Y22_02835 [Gemmatimonadaceae bacterium]|nr:hypothetical protein [Gloeobacterales cyanobacterium ES-bin-141]